MSDKANLQLSAERGSFPLWLSTPHGVRNTDPVLLNLSAELTTALVRWKERYDETYDPENPSGSGFPDDAERDSFYQEGHRLAEQLARELDWGYDIFYLDRRYGTTVETDV